MGDAIRFIHKNGRVIPIRAAGVGIAAGRDSVKTAAAVGVRHAFRKEPNIKGNSVARAGSMGLALAGGVLSGATFGGSAKGFIAGHVASVGVDLGSTALGIGAFAGRGHAKARAKAAAGQELTNQAIGWSAFAATALAVPSSRKRLVGAAQKVLAFGRKALTRA